jgi:hypothetical protein
MADRPGDRFALIAEAARYLVNVRHNDRDQCLGAGVNPWAGSCCSCSWLHVVILTTTCR